MKLDKDKIFVPDGLPVQSALARTTDLCFAAHQDDVEIMAYNAISDCFGSPERWFTACVLSDGAGSPRNGIYAEYTGEQMQAVRFEEQNKAAVVGGYAAQIQLKLNSAAVKKTQNDDCVRQIVDIVLSCSPDVVYTHNLADKHETHVATALRVVAALRSLPGERRPKKLYGMEVWRSLDWLSDAEKVMFDASAHPNLATALLGVYDSQICGGKRYDLATIGRRTANATFFESHGVDQMAQAIYAMDITELMYNDMPVETYICEKIRAFEKQVYDTLGKLSD